jgi:hypothetical protein
VLPDPATKNRLNKDYTVDVLPATPEADERGKSVAHNDGKHACKKRRTLRRGHQPHGQSRSTEQINVGQQNIAGVLAVTELAHEAVKCVTELSKAKVKVKLS